MLTPRRLKNLVDKAVALDREIAEKADELKAIKKKLIEQAKAETKGKANVGSIAWPGNDGCIARVTFPKRKLKATIDDGSKATEKIKSLLTPKEFKNLFYDVQKHGLMDGFREYADIVCKDSSKRKKLLALCTTASSPAVSFETKTADDVASTRQGAES